MCGIAGLIHRGKSGKVGQEMTSMLQSLWHRGPDSAGFGLYGAAQDNHLVMRLKLAETEELNRGYGVEEEIEHRDEQVRERLHELGAKLIEEDSPTVYARRYVIDYNGDMNKFAEWIQDDHVEILSIGHSLELIKDLGSAGDVADKYGLQGFSGTHGIGHTRMATESDVDISSAHPYWAFPYNDVSVVHNGQLTNYWKFRRQLEHVGHRFHSNCDSELIAVFIADRMERGDELEEAMNRSIYELDGVFTYIVATSHSLGMAKDTMAAKPLVLYEDDQFVAMASEEVAIRSVFPHEIDTIDPYEEEVRVWHA
ncbi:MAG TPA: glutamine amidotransferase [Gammaproteobacteria bacterium]|nr:glutamine amidotransferase [Gammaproteobacteria bacterium]